MDLWMYLVVIGMFLIATVGTVWITLWTIQRRKAAVAAMSAPADGAPAPRVVRTVSTRAMSTAPTTTTSDGEPDGEAKTAG